MATPTVGEGRNITAGELARTASIESWSPEQTAHRFDPPIEAVIEALRYAETARELIAAEEAEDRIVTQRYERQRAPVSG